MECTNDVCGMRRVGWQRRKGSEWWNEEVGRAVAEMRRAFGNGSREEIGLPMTDTGRREWLRNWQSKLQKEWRTGDGESDWGMISRVTKRCFGKR